MKGVKCILSRKLFIISVLFFVPLLISLKNIKPASATSINSLLATQAEYTKNFESSTTIENHNSLHVPGNVVDITQSNLTGFWYYRQNFVFTNPVQNHSGTGFNHSIYFTLTSDYPYLNDNISSLMAFNQLRFEGISLQQPYCTSNYSIISLSKTSTTSSVRFKFSSSCPAGTYSTTQNFQNVLASISYYPDSMFWCANDSDRPCSNGILRITISDIDYNFEVLNSSQDSTNQTIINQNQTIINQNQHIIDQDNQDREDLQNQQNDSQSSASSAGSDVNNAGTRLLDVVTTFFGLFISPPQRDCKIRADLGHMDLGTIDLCELSPPPAFSILASLIMIGATIPFAISVINTLLKLMEGALST